MDCRPNFKIGGNCCSLLGVTDDHESRLLELETKDTSNDLLLTDIKDDLQNAMNDINNIKNVNDIQQNAIENNTSEIALIKNVNNVQNDRLTAIETSDLLQNNRLTNAETSIQTIINTNISQNDKIAALEASDAVQNTRLNNNATSIQNLTNELDIAKNDIVGIKTVNDNQNTQITTINSTINNIQNKDIEQDSRLLLLENKDVTNDAQLQNILTDLNSAKNDIVSIQNKDIEQDTAITTINNNILNINTKDIEQDTKITQLEQADVVLETQITTINNNILNIQNKDIEQDNRLTLLEQTDAVHDTKIDANTNSINNLINGVQNQNLIIGNLQTNEALQDQRISVAEGNITTNATKISLLEIDNDINKSNITNIQDDITLINNELNTKVDKVAGLGLSEESFTSDEKAKLALLNCHIEPCGETIQSDWNSADNTNPNYIWNKPTSMPNPEPLIFPGDSYDGSTQKTIDKTTFGIDTIENNIIELQQDINSNFNAITNISSIVAGHTTQLNNIDNTLLNLVPRVASVETNYNNIQNGLFNTNEQLNNQLERIDFIENITIPALINDIENNETNIEQNANDIDSLKIKVETNENDIDTLKAQVEINENNIDNLKIEVESNAIDITDLNIQVETNMQDIENNAQNIIDLETYVKENYMLKEQNLLTPDDIGTADTILDLVLQLGCGSFFLSGASINSFGFSDMPTDYDVNGVGCSIELVSHGGTIENGNLAAHVLMTKRNSPKAQWIRGISSNTWINNWNMVGEQGFSTSEHITGKLWVDGKPIYRRVFNGTTATTNDATVTPGTIANIETVISISGGVHPTSVLFVPFGFRRTQTNEETNCFIGNNGSVNIQVTGAPMQNRPFRAIIEYTKI